MKNNYIEEIEKFFGAKFEKAENSYSIRIINENTNSNISLEIFVEENDRYLISVYTSNTHFQLQNCSGFIVSEMLEEVIFISETDSMISGLIISKKGDCALYSNVDKRILNSDFSDLNSEKLLSAVALSITETIDSRD